ncbi:hypothetical protein D0T12_11850 [Actinomadura spongiicola]|uniref:Uncharacterized protein n=1 Tax=Actinomadura spongiicola TaxID=2303421 RepID=A0A372GK01_9ACTN|nr:hypothetical protein [Actinomadura spongiicola]RFS85687.1 hypothetical protein D0T12_11850 [Actinomadura spongiicola]
MDNQRWRLYFPGGFILGIGAVMLLATPVFGIATQKPSTFIMLIPAMGWIIGGYLVLRATKYSGRRIAGFVLIGLSITTVSTLLGQLLMRLAGE